MASKGDASEQLNRDLREAQAQCEELRAQLGEAQETLRAIREGEVDALVVNTPQGERLFTLQGADQAYRTLIEEMQEGAATLTGDGIIHYSNRRLAKMLGVPLETMVGRRLRDHADPAHRAELDRCIAEALREGVARGELLLARADGGVLPAYIAISRVAMEDARSYCVVVTDLTEHHVNEQLQATVEELTVAEERLAQALQRLDAHMDNSPLAVIEFGADMRLTRWSKEAERIFGWQAEEVLGKSMGDFRWVYEEDAGQVQQVFRDLQRGIQRFSQNRNYRKDGSVVLCNWYNSTLVDAKGYFQSILSLVLDVTERERTRTALQEAKALAESASSAKDQFIAVLSHELRTPLTPVLTTVQMLERNGAAPEVVRESLAMVRRNIELEARLIDDLLDVTRIARGKLSLDVRTVDVHAKLANVVEMCREEIDAKQQTLTLELAAEAHNVQADPARLQQIFWNVLRNATKFTPVGGSIAVGTADIEGGRIAVAVRDTGVGIAGDALPHIFAPFDQGDHGTNRTFGGLGLGLSITKGLVDLHGGEIRAHSDGPGKGATFTVELPLSVHAAEPPPAPLSGAGEAVRRTCSILLVDDHPDTARTMARLLSALGYERVCTAESIAAAIAVAQGQRFDILISDIGLPDGTGHDLMRHLRAMYPIKGVALSGYGQPEDIRRSQEAGFAEHLTKPIQLDLFEQAIRRLLD